MTNGRDGREVSWNEVSRKEEVRVDWATTVRRTERGGMVGATGGGGTRDCVRGGRRFSFPLTLLVDANFFHVGAGMPSPSPGEPLSTRKKLLVKAKAVVDAASEAERLDLDGRRAGGAVAGSRLSATVSWCCVEMVKTRPCPCPSCPLKKQRSCLISIDAGGGVLRHCTLTFPPRLFFASGLGVLPLLIKGRDDDASLCSAGVGCDDVDADSPADHGGILDGDPARRGPNSLAGSGRLQLVSAVAGRGGTAPRA
jgi:hypothetical protein